MYARDFRKDQPALLPINSSCILPVFNIFIYHNKKINFFSFCWIIADLILTSNINFFYESQSRT